MQAPKKKALCIGVAYTRNPIEYHLGGSHNDAMRVAKMLEEHYKYTVEILLDKESYIHPTRENIKAAIARLVEDAQPGDCLFFHFSGHGDQIPNLDGTEKDGKDEVILPSDFRTDPKHPNPHDRDRYPEDGRILDDELHEWLVKPIPSGCYLNALFDNCHSGTALDLSHRRYTDRIFDEPSPMGSPTEARAPEVRTLEGRTPLSRVGSETRSRQNSLGIENALEIGYAVSKQGSSSRKFSAPAGRGRLIVRGQSEDQQHLQIQGGNVFSWCACSDAQQAGESMVSGSASGYMVDAFLECLAQTPTPTYSKLLLSLNERLQDICNAYNSQNGRRPSQHVNQDPEFGSHLLPDMNATIVI